MKFVNPKWDWKRNYIDLCIFRTGCNPTWYKESNYNKLWLNHSFIFATKHLDKLDISKFNTKRFQVIMKSEFLDIKQVTMCLIYRFINVSSW